MDVEAVSHYLVQANLPRVALGDGVGGDQSDSPAIASCDRGRGEQHVRHKICAAAYTAAPLPDEMVAIVRAVDSGDLLPAQVRRVSDDGVEAPLVPLEYLGEEEREMRRLPDPTRPISQCEVDALLQRRGVGARRPGERLGELDGAIVARLRSAEEAGCRQRVGDADEPVGDRLGLPEQARLVLG